MPMNQKKKEERSLIDLLLGRRNNFKNRRNKVYAPDGVKVGLEVKRTVGNKLTAGPY